MRCTLCTVHYAPYIMHCTLAQASRGSSTPRPTWEAASGAVASRSVRWLVSGRQIMVITINADPKRDDLVSCVPTDESKALI